jgi:hypothetical protein
VQWYPLHRTGSLEYADICRSKTGIRQHHLVFFSYMYVSVQWCIVLTRSDDLSPQWSVQEGMVVGPNECGHRCLFGSLWLLKFALIFWGGWVTWRLYMIIVFLKVETHHWSGPCRHIQKLLQHTQTPAMKYLRPTWQSHG